MKPLSPTSTLSDSLPRRLALMSALVVASGVVFAPQARAISALDVVNKFSLGNGVGVTKDIAYGDDALQNLDIYYPKDLAEALRQSDSGAVSHDYPMVVFVHGGSWQSGNKDDYAFVGESLAQAGYVTAVINYRKAPEHVYPDYVQDTAQAIAWSHEHAANYYADADRLAVVGHSAGAFNAVAAIADKKFLAPYGMQPTDIRAVVGIAGPYSYDFREYPTAVAFPSGATPDEVMPDRHITGAQPPYLLLTAGNDKTVYPQNAINMQKALLEHGVDVETGVIDGASHATSIGAFASPLRWLNDSRAQVLNYLQPQLSAAPPKSTESLENSAN